jgi:hypothetical protein
MVKHVLGDNTVTGKSHKRHIASSVLSPGPALLNSPMPCGPPRKQLSILVGRSVGRLVDRSQGSHRNITLPLQFHHLGPPFPTLLRPARHPQNGLKIWLVGWLVGRSVGQSVTGKSQERHAASSVSAPRPALPDPSTPCGPPQNGLKFWLVGRSVSPSVTGKSHEHHAAYSVSSPGPALPNPSTSCAPPPKRP